MTRYLALALFTAALAPAQASETAPATPKAAPYALISKRNIFDATRQPERSKPAAPKPEKAIPPPPAKTIEVTGCADNGSQRLVFFSSTEKEINGRAAVGESLGGMTLLKINGREVTVSLEGNELVCPVGGRLSDQGKGEWLSSAPTPITTQTSRKETVSDRPPKGAPDEALDGALDDALDELDNLMNSF
jgi:hypothetical protein